MKTHLLHASSSWKNFHKKNPISKNLTFSLWSKYSVVLRLHCWSKHYWLEKSVFYKSSCSFSSKNSFKRSNEVTAALIKIEKLNKDFLQTMRSTWCYKAREGTAEYTGIRGRLPELALVQLVLPRRQVKHKLGKRLSFSLETYCVSDTSLNKNEILVFLKA